MKTFKEVVEEGKSDFVALTNTWSYQALENGEAELGVDAFLDTFAAKIRQATLAEAREKIEVVAYTEAQGMSLIPRAEALTALEDKEESV